MLTPVTGPASEPLTLAEVRAHLRLDTTNAEPSPWSAPSAALAGAGAGNVNNGAHRYRVTFVTATGETDGGVESAAVTVANSATDGKVNVTAIPLGGSAVTARKVYRTQAGGTSYFLLTTLADNTTTTYLDNTADASLGVGCPTVNSTDDQTLSRLITVARRKVESITRRALYDQTWKLTLDRFPPSIQLGICPVKTVTSLKYIDQTGTQLTLDPSLYVLDNLTEPAWIVPVYQKIWPIARAVLNAVEVTFTAGYGTSPNLVPPELMLAMMQLCAQWYDNRESAIMDRLDTVPYGIDELLEPLRVFTFA